MFDKKKIEEGIRLLLEGIGENPDREGLKDTPDRVARMYEELCSGMNMSPKEHLSKTFTCDNENVVIEKDITFYSTCEHHLMPFYGKVGAKGVLVMAQAEHMCMSARGIKKPGSKTVTFASTGVFEEDRNLRSDVLSIFRDGQ